MAKNFLTGIRERKEKGVFEEISKATKQREPLGSHTEFEGESNHGYRSYKERRLSDESAGSDSGYHEYRRPNPYGNVKIKRNGYSLSESGLYNPDVGRGWAFIRHSSIRVSPTSIC